MSSICSGSAQKYRYVSPPLRLSKVKRRHLTAISNIKIGPGVDQQPYDFFVAARCRDHQRRPPTFVVLIC